MLFLLRLFNSYGIEHAISGAKMQYNWGGWESTLMLGWEFALHELVLSLVIGKACCSWEDVFY